MTLTRNNIIWPLQYDRNTQWHYVANSSWPPQVAISYGHPIRPKHLANSWRYNTKAHCMTTWHPPVIWSQQRGTLYGHLTSPSDMVTRHEHIVWPLDITQWYGHNTRVHCMATWHHPVIWPQHMSTLHGHLTSPSDMVTTCSLLEWAPLMSISYDLLTWSHQVSILFGNPKWPLHNLPTSCSP